MYEVIFHEDAIEIQRDGIESHYWSKDEWEQDPEIVFAIANAVLSSKTNPKLLDETSHADSVKKLQGEDTEFKACPNCGSTAQEIGRIEAYNMTGVDLNMADTNAMGLEEIISASPNADWEIVYLVCLGCGQLNDYNDLVSVPRPTAAFKIPSHADPSQSEIEHMYLEAGLGFPPGDES